MMHRISHSLSSFLLILIALTIGVQRGLAELNATVRITVPKLQTADPKIFKTLEQQVFDFFNNQSWTDLEYEEEEKIECAFQINITEELSQNTFKADVAIQATRPVYGSTYKTSLITHVDKDIVFNYEEYQPLEDSRNFFRNNLSSVLSFYAMIIIGLDFDSFTELGGSPYFNVAQGIVNSIPPSVIDQDAGWNSLQGNKTNRFWLIENLLSPKVRPYRQAMYNYHRHGLDLMYTDVVSAQRTMLQAINTVDQVRQTYPTIMVGRMFALAKSEEILEVFKGADRGTRNQVKQVMQRLDVSNAQRYNELQ